MADIREITDFSAPELDIFARLRENQLANWECAEKGIFIAESPKVIGRALMAGYEPISFLMERRHVESQGKDLLQRCGEVPVFTAEKAVLAQMTGFHLTRGMLCAMKRRELPDIAQVCAGARRVAVLERVMNPTNVGAIFRSAAALGMDAVLLSPSCCDPLCRRAIRVSMGTVFQVPWARLGEEKGDWPEAGLARPLKTLTAATKKISEGDLKCRSGIKSRDEFGQLSESFDAMAQRLEESMNEMQDSVRRREEFMGSFAHEMKTPMTSIIGYADFIRSGSLDEEEQMNAANYIFSEGKRLESLSAKLLDIIVMNNRKIELRSVSPAQLISHLVEYLKPIYSQEGIVLQYKCEEGECLLEPDLVKSLVSNLIDNSRKSFTDGGNIYLRSRMLPDGCEIRVLDNGPGIPPEAIDHLTEAFYRVDKSRSRMQGGAGLGLALCSDIAKLHNGTLRIESRIGNGTEVTAELHGGRI